MKEMTPREKFDYMMSFTTNVNALILKTNMPVSQCVEALDKANNDFEKAYYMLLEVKK